MAQIISRNVAEMVKWYERQAEFEREQGETCKTQNWIVGQLLAFERAQIYERVARDLRSLEIPHSPREDRVGVSNLG